MSYLLFNLPALPFLKKFQLHPKQLSRSATRNNWFFVFSNHINRNRSQINENIQLEVESKQKEHEIQSPERRILNISPKFEVSFRRSDFFVKTYLESSF